MSAPGVAELMPYVAALARCVELLRRSPEPEEPQKAALKSLTAVAAERSAVFRYYGGLLTVEAVPIPMADARIGQFVQRLAGQNVAEIVIARGADPLELLALCNGLAAEPGHGRIKERLRDASSTRVMVVVHQQVDAGHRPVTISGAFAKVRSDQATLAEWNKFLNHGAKSVVGHDVDLGLKERATGEIQININAGEGEHAVSVGPRAVEAQPPAPPPPPPPEPPKPTLQQPPTLHAASPMGIGLARVAGDPYGKNILDRLTPLSRAIEDAFTKGNAAEAIDAMNALIELEAKAPDQGIRTTYGVIVGRTLTRPALARVVPYLLETRRRQRAAVVLRRGGEPSIGLLLEEILQSNAVGERVIYAEVLREIPQGLDRLLGYLSSRSDWQQARIVAELAGEAQLDAAVPHLARLVEHGDDRVKRSALVAMAKIGSMATVEPLRAILGSGARELRAVVAASIGGAQAKGLVPMLSALAESEESPDIARELVKAIGRIGTPEARQVLTRLAGQKALFSRRGKATREAAEETLKAIGAA